ncbi:unnamed protein product [Trichogramma brassicae]|uniref:Uncharacterized protein n=1 Tax=Trichogramma brassicae TaxID=86971 RepID=A0A6H5IS04_9HYME|nr:unnamed protein product [Trichogramma brassicae]
MDRSLVFKRKEKTSCAQYTLSSLPQQQQLRTSGSRVCVHVAECRIVIVYKEKSMSSLTVLQDVYRSSSSEHLMYLTHNRTAATHRMGSAACKTKLRALFVSGHTRIRHGVVYVRILSSFLFVAYTRQPRIFAFLFILHRLQVAASTEGRCYKAAAATALSFRTTTDDLALAGWRAFSSSTVQVREKKVRDKKKRVRNKIRYSSSSSSSSEFRLRNPIIVNALRSSRLKRLSSAPPPALCRAQCSSSSSSSTTTTTSGKLVNENFAAHHVAELNYLAAGLRPFWYHATNVALHAAACMLVTRVSLAVASLRPGFAALTGLLFAAHPIHTDACIAHRNSSVTSEPDGDGATTTTTTTNLNILYCFSSLSRHRRHLCRPTRHAGRVAARTNELFQRAKSNYERISIVASRATLKTAREQKTANTVTGIVGRADVLACVFFLLSFLAYHGTQRSPRFFMQPVREEICEKIEFVHAPKIGTQRSRRLLVQQLNRGGRTMITIQLFSSVFKKKSRSARIQLIYIISSENSTKWLANLSADCPDGATQFVRFRQGCSRAKQSSYDVVYKRFHQRRNHLSKSFINIRRCSRVASGARERYSWTIADSTVHYVHAHASES